MALLDPFFCLLFSAVTSVSAASVPIVSLAIDSGDPFAAGKAHNCAVALGQTTRLEELYLKRIRTVSPEMQGPLISALGSFPTTNDETIRLLASIVDDDRSPNRDRAAYSLGSKGLQAKAALGTLERNLPTSDGMLRHAICIAIWNITEKSDLIGPIILQGLTSKRAMDRFFALRSIQMMGPKIKYLVGLHVLSLLFDHIQEVRIEAAKALPSVSLSADVSAFVLSEALARTKQKQGVFDSYIAAGEIPLDQYQEHSRWLDFEMATIRHSILKIGDPALPYLARLATSQQANSVRAVAIETIGMMGPVARLYIPYLLMWSMCHDPIIKDAAIRALITLTIE